MLLYAFLWAVAWTAGIVALTALWAWLTRRRDAMLGAAPRGTSTVANPESLPPDSGRPGPSPVTRP